MTDNSSGAEPGPSHRTVEIGTALLTLAFAGVVIVGALQAGIGWGSEGPKAGFFPFYVGLIIAGAGILNLVQAIGEPRDRLFAEWGQLRQVFSVIVPTAGYVALIPWLGFYAASVLLIGLFMRWLGGYRWTLVAAVSIGVPVLAFLMFEKWFLVPLPKGPLEDLLGL
ncbi:MAG: tripartite tricarboxylate transporter TctB family protein [Variibacter sp.]|nr:tripartite tricarboxylate transporter TctB family protein [Variibacter sp.]